MLDHPQLRHIERTGYPIPVRNPQIFMVDKTNCDACPDYAAVLRFRGMSLCESCAGEERIELL